jgi:hypothetical protein
MPMGRNKFRADFNRGVIPTIACVNKSKIGLGVDFDELIPALQKFLDECFLPVWARRPNSSRPEKQGREIGI